MTTEAGKVRRFHFQYDDYGNIEFTEHYRGNYVLHADYEASERRCGELATDRDYWRNTASDYGAQIGEQQQRIAALEQQVSDMQGCEEACNLVERALDGLDYRGTYADGITLLRQQVAELRKDAGRAAMTAEGVERDE